MSTEYNFQYCQKIVLFDAHERVLLARRQGEEDFDGTYSFIGGKMEVTDGELIDGLRREKEEEIGRRAIVLVAPHISYNVLYRKKNGSSMVLPHVYGRYEGGEIDLNEEYSDYKWVDPTELEDFGPKIDTVEDAVKCVQSIKRIVTESDLVRI